MSEGCIWVGRIQLKSFWKDTSLSPLCVCVCVCVKVKKFSLIKPNYILQASCRLSSKLFFLERIRRGHNSNHYCTLKKKLKRGFLRFTNHYNPQLLKICFCALDHQILSNGKSASEYLYIHAEIHYTCMYV